MMNIPSQWRNW